MKQIKKIVALTLALCMLLSITAFAAPKLTAADKKFIKLHDATLLKGADAMNKMLKTQKFKKYQVLGEATYAEGLTADLLTSNAKSIVTVEKDHMLTFKSYIYATDGVSKLDVYIYTGSVSYSKTGKMFDYYGELMHSCASQLPEGNRYKLGDILEEYYGVDVAATLIAASNAYVGPLVPDTDK